jgi:hypothetical protein
MIPHQEKTLPFDVHFPICGEIEPFCVHQGVVKLYTLQYKTIQADGRRDVEPDVSAAQFSVQ